MLQVALSLATCTWFNQLKQVLRWSNGFICKPPFGTKTPDRTCSFDDDKIWHMKCRGH